MHVNVPMNFKQGTAAECMNSDKRFYLIYSAFRVFYHYAFSDVSLPVSGLIKCCTGLNEVDKINQQEIMITYSVF